MNRLRLTAGQLRRLEQQLTSTIDAAVYRRTLALLEVGRGEPVARVAGRLRVARASIYHWLDRFRPAGDPSALAHRPGAGRPTVWDDELLGALCSALASTPQDLGYRAVEWTIPLLREHLAERTGRRVADDTLRRELHRRGFVWKRPRYILVPDPEREKKTAHPQAGVGTGSPCRGTI
jgi:transposase